ncbi:hypothetical protein [uncultured Dubosiella sp.]|uniref:hypothetical protein n=1 Tax=uncultured Dubosiella sp. TaxID=1937011 RepID=UPI00259AB3FE|nr:hypothetical protein [uncultured Dubosiella sp.]
MKKITIFILTLIFGFGLTACSKNAPADLSLEFFNALHHTFQADSAHVEFNIVMNEDDPSEILANLYFNQKNQLALAATSSLKAGGRTQDNFLDFYIKDGKTYLNSMGVKTQSVIEKIGLKTDSKLTNLDPFLDMTDEELKQVFTSGKKEGDTYSFDINKGELAKLLDAYGSVDVDHATLEAKINDGVVTDLRIDADLAQKIDEHALDTSIAITIRVSDYDKLSSIPFPDDLDTYKIDE